MALAALHYGEEPALAAEDGAGAVFFSGCSLRCVYCQNYPVSRGQVGRQISVEKLAEIFQALEEQGAQCIDLVNPSHFQPAIAQALTLYRPKVVVWNSSGYESVETLQAMEGLVDVYLPDCKYLSGSLSAQLSGAGDYFLRASKALREMARQVGRAQVDDKGRMLRGMIVRHLVLPGHVDDTRKVLTWIRHALPEAWLSLMAQYTPCGQVEAFPELQRELLPEEYEAAVAIMEELGFSEGYVQELSAAGTAQIPIFDETWPEIGDR